MPQYVKGVETSVVELSRRTETPLVFLEVLTEGAQVVVIEIDNIIDEQKIYDFVEKLRKGEV